LGGVGSLPWAASALSLGRRRRSPLDVKLHIAERLLALDAAGAGDDLHVPVGDLPLRGLTRMVG
jgi:hypothetical protein